MTYYMMTHKTFSIAAFTVSDVSLYCIAVYCVCVYIIGYDVGIWQCSKVLLMMNDVSVFLLKLRNIQIALLSVSHSSLVSITYCIS